MMFYFTRLLLLLSGGLGLGIACQPKSPVVSSPVIFADPLVLALAQTNILADRYVGRNPQEHAQFARFRQLLEKYPPTQIQALTQHPNPVVRAYAFWGLAKQQSQNLDEIILQMARDTTQIRTLVGCLADSSRVIDFALRLSTTDDIDPEARKISPKTQALLQQKGP
ncbi:MAG: hypothetical protein HC913_20465 [Microscillaceae bacterium]|nr:hypothetical protein [Microscillaceae bacterium]